MKRAGDLVSKVVEYLMAALLAIMVVLVFGNAAGRYLFATGFAASEELSRLAFVWLIFLGAILAVRERAHVGVDMLVQRFSPLGKRISLGAMNILILYALWLFAKGSWQQTIIGMDSVTPVTGVPLAAFAVVGVIAAVSMAVLFTLDLIRLFTGRVRDDELIQVRETADREIVVAGPDGTTVPVVPVPAEGPRR
jgi:TRAP-type C4-dicarboxylate transport system permease small subunit